MTTVETKLPSPHIDSPGPTASELSSTSLCLGVPQSSSPFPSPSSSFLPPPIHGIHEFAIRPPPSGYPTLAAHTNDSQTAVANGNGDVSAKDRETTVATEPDNGKLEPSETIKDPSFTSESQAAPMPLAILQETPKPISTQVTAVSATPTPSPIKIPSPLPSPSPVPNNPLTPNRPAPPSPSASRRVSSMSTFSTRSPAPSASASVSRANSVRRSSRLSASTSPYTPAQSAAASAAVIVHVQNSKPRVYIHIRDFAFDKTDERFHGAGALVPRANHLAVLHRKLAGLPEDGDEEASGSEPDAEDVNVAWDNLRTGWSVNGRGSSSPMEDGPSQEEIDLNFGSATEEDYDDYEGDGVEAAEEPLYPGLYRAVYAFEPEGTAEMALIEDQVVRVIGRGGGIGWAVVIDESTGLNEDGGPRHALVPESYLEAVRLDWEDEEEAT